MPVYSNSDKQKLQPATLLWELYQPDKAPHAFTATDISQAIEWQKNTRKRLAETIGLAKLASSPLNPRIVEQAEKPDYIRQKLLIETGPYTLMPVYMLLPKNVPQPLPVIMAFHGHGYGVKDIVGLWEEGQERDTPEGYQSDFAVALCRAGFAVAAPEISCFGERQTDFSYINEKIGQSVPSTCTHSAMLAFHLGISVAGLRVHDGLRLVDYLETREDLDTTRLGTMGISGGGMHTFFSTCLDERIRACAISGYFSTFRNSILAMSHCACNFVPGLAEFGEMYDLACLIAPRPVFIESGNYDPIFPVQAVKSSVEKLRSRYNVFNAGDKVFNDIFEGKHRINGHKAYAFFNRIFNNS